ncbi:DNA primase [Methanobrevibacter olleyae]|uniref:DNA primase DnaG n=1 Tax=Methanobrevibacter olleyae TaxID=294671 RepID=A0A1I4HQ35_METOL|nr:DNA primase DnaG [Methanobrevibacter olleyae]SFL43873.1 DNA primase [Methanobrevibacter olleyae]
MGKGIELTTTKYLIHAQINANGIVEKPDVVGAVFGQTEGLLSNDLDLRELQRTGRIGRIQVIIHSNGGRAKGEIVIPSSLDRIETAILAASLETINRVGPCEASIEILRVEDVRAVKRQQVINRAKEIYMSMMETVSPESMKMIEEIRESMRVHEISEFGEERLPAGPNVHTSDAIIVVEGRNDVLNLLKYGIKNTVAVEGVNIPNSVAELTKKRTVTAFVDGDRGGELILKELLQVGDVDYVTRAPRGKEVEDLEKEEILIALRDKAPTEQVINNLDFNLDTQVKIPKNKINRTDRKSSDRRTKNLNKSDKFHGNKNGRADRKDKFDRKDRKNGRNDRRGKDRNSRGRRDRNSDKIQDSRIKLLKNMLKDLEGTGNSEILDDSLNLLKETKVETLYEELKQNNTDADTVIFDGVISQRLVDIAYSKGIKTLVAFKSSRVIKRPDKLRLVTLN